MVAEVQKVANCPIYVARKRLEIELTTDVIVDTTEFCESKNASQNSESRPRSMPQTDSDGFMNIPDGIDEELPFN